MTMGWIIALGICWIFIVPVILKWLWNMTMPELFGLKTIVYWQSFQLIIIFALLFGGAGFKLAGGS